MKRLHLITKLFLILIIPVNGQEFKKGEWAGLFNGYDFENWTIKFTGHELNDNYKNTFRAEDGILKVSYDEYERFSGEFGHIFYKDKFSNYRIRLEYRFTGEQIEGGPEWGLLNSGIMLHSQSPESMRRDQNFPVSIEAQFLGDSGSGKRSTGNVCTPGTNIVMHGKLITEHCIAVSNKIFPPGQWVPVEIEVHGDSLIKHIINGEVVCEYDKPQLDTTDTDAQKLIKNGNILLKEGFIALQAESHPVEFRNIKIMVLDK